MLTQHAVGFHGQPQECKPGESCHPQLYHYVPSIQLTCVPTRCSVRPGAYWSRTTIRDVGCFVQSSVGAKRPICKGSHCQGARCPWDKDSCIACLRSKPPEARGSQVNIQVKIGGQNVGAIEKADANTSSTNMTSCGMSTTDASCDPTSTEGFNYVHLSTTVRMSNTSIADACVSTGIIWH